MIRLFCGLGLGLGLGLIKNGQIEWLKIKANQNLCFWLLQSYSQLFWSLDLIKKKLKLKKMHVECPECGASAKNMVDSGDPVTVAPCGHIRCKPCRDRNFIEVERYFTAQRRFARMSTAPYRPYPCFIYKPYSCYVCNKKYHAKELINWFIHQ